MNVSGLPFLKHSSGRLNPTIYFLLVAGLLVVFVFGMAACVSAQSEPGWESEWADGWSLPEKLTQTHPASGPVSAAVDDNGEIHLLTVDHDLQQGIKDILLNGHKVHRVESQVRHLNLVLDDNSGYHLAWVEHWLGEGRHALMYKYLPPSWAGNSTDGDLHVLREVARPLRDVTLSFTPQQALLFCWTDMTEGLRRVFTADMEPGQPEKLAANQLTSSENSTETHSQPTILKDREGITYLWWVRQAEIRNYLMFWAYDEQMEPLFSSPLQLGTVSGQPHQNAQAVAADDEVFAVWAGTVSRRGETVGSGVTLGRFDSDGTEPDTKVVSLAGQMEQFVHVNALAPDLFAYEHPEKDRVLVVAWSNSDPREEDGRLRLYSADVFPQTLQVNSVGLASLQEGEPMWPQIIASPMEEKGESLTIVYHVPSGHETIEVWAVSDAEPASPNLAFFLNLSPQQPWSDALFKTISLFFAGLGLLIVRFTPIVVTVGALTVLDRLDVLPQGEKAPYVIYLLTPALIFLWKEPDNILYWRAVTLSQPWGWAIFALAAMLSAGVLIGCNRNPHESLNWMLSGVLFTFLNAVFSLIPEGTRLHMFISSEYSSFWPQKALFIGLLLIAGWQLD